MDALIRLVFKLLRALGVFPSVKRGDFDVVGIGSVSIPLGGYRHVQVIGFDDDDCYALPPCGGGLPDTLDWEVVKRGHKCYTLEVSWSVNRPRRFVWVVSWR
jgi:hypothetical protein